MLKCTRASLNLNDTENIWKVIFRLINWACIQKDSDKFSYHKKDIRSSEERKEEEANPY